jgi:putative NADH-flavin reductase
MKLVVFGANGTTGRLLTRQLLDADNTVVAVTRRPATFPITDPRLTVAEVDAFQQQEVADVLPGADAVLSVLGVSFTRRPVDTFST